MAATGVPHDGSTVASKQIGHTSSPTAAASPSRCSGKGAKYPPPEEEPRVAGARASCVHADAADRLPLADDGAWRGQLNTVTKASVVDQSW